MIASSRRFVASCFALTMVACIPPGSPSKQPHDGGSSTRDATGDLSAVGAELPCTPRQLSVGHDHACALLVDGRGYCWGNPAGGAFTPNDDAPDEPALVGDRGAEITAGFGATCMRLVDASVRCWGALVTGKPSAPLAPLEVGGNASQVVLGPGRGCVLRSDGAVMCWGPAGMVGSADGMAHDTPAPLPPFPGRVAALAAGEAGTCAVQLDGAVFCWGTLPAPIGAVTTPTPLPFPQLRKDERVLSVGVGRDHVCVLSTANAVHCIGPDGSAMAEWGDVARLTIGPRHGCALLRDGSLACFGANSEGQLDGRPGAPVTLHRPRFVARVDNVGWATVSAGGRQTCVIDQRLVARCWGNEPTIDGGVAPADPIDGGVTDGGVDAPARDPETSLGASRLPALPRHCP